VFVFKMPVARLEDLVSATIAHVAPRAGLDPAGVATQAMAARAGEKSYEELMTQDESSRAYDIGEMYAVLPSIAVHPKVAEAYHDVPPAPVGAYRSDSVAAMTPDEVHRLVAEALAAGDDAGPDAALEDTPAGRTARG
jgi:FlaA1/EpsC-like NDP-sugar epimerase